MALAYSEFVTTQANLVADLKTAITASSDWSNITGNILKATTTRGAQMVVDLTDAAITLNVLTIAFYRTHDGSSGVDKITRYIYFKRAAAGATTNNVYCVVSASKEHLFVSIEGPRPGQTGASDASYGSFRDSFFIGDLVPYHAGDSVPAVVSIANMNNSAARSLLTNNHQAYVSRNYLNTQSWVTARLLTMSFGGAYINWQFKAAIDGNYYVFPYLVMEDQDGLRGRLNNVYFAGWGQPNSLAVDLPPNVGSRISYGGQTLKLLRPFKGDGSNNGGQDTWNALGMASNASTSNVNHSPVVAVPST
jgi:hypothetical protein